MSGLAPVVLAALWPFAAPAAEAPTVGSVGPALEAPAAANRPPDAARAADAYAAFLALPGQDPDMRRTARRRLADLRLEAAEEALGAGRDASDLLAEARALYGELLAGHPGAAEADQWLYQLARAQAMSGREALAEEALGRLVATRPDSPLAAEAWFRVGEGRFLARDWAAAEDAYLRAVDSDPAGPFAEQARYKLGWTLFKEGRHLESFEPFAGVLDGRLGDAEIESLDRAGRELAEDSLRAVAIGLAALDGVGSLDAWLDGRGGPGPAWAGLAYRTLGDLYRDQERYTDAAAAYTAWGRRAPLDGSAPAMHALAIDTLAEGGFEGEALEAMASFADRYDPAGPWWAEPRGDEGDPVRARVLASLDALAAWHHARFQAGEADIGPAAAWYRRRLETFPDAADAPRQHFLLAELLYQGGRPAEAAEAYGAVAYGYGPHPDAAEAGYAAVVARRDLAADAGAGDPADQALIAAEQAFARGFPADPRAADVQLDAAERLLRAGRLEDAQAEALDLLAREPASTAGRAATLVVGHAAFDLGRYARAEQAYAGWLAGGGTGELVASVTDRLAASIYRQGQAAAAAGETDAAVDHFLRVGALAPASGIAATAHYDAAALWSEAGAWPAAARAYGDFVAAWPDHPLADEARIGRAQALVHAGDAGPAAEALVVVSGLEAEPEALRREALWQATEFFEEAGLADRAEAALADYVARFPEPAEPAMEARWRLAGFAAGRDDAQARRRWLAEIVAARDALADHASPRSNTLAARAALELAAPALAGFEVVALAPPLETSVPEKAARMERALEALGKAAGYGVAEVTTEAAYRMAEMYREMGRALLASARPADLDPESLEQYEMLLEEQAFPFEEEAIAIHEANAARAREGLYDRWVVQSFDALAELVPARWNRDEKGERLVQLGR